MDERKVSQTSTYIVYHLYFQAKNYDFYFGNTTTKVIGMLNNNTLKMFTSKRQIVWPFYHRQILAVSKNNVTANDNNLKA